MNKFTEEKERSKKLLATAVIPGPIDMLLISRDESDSVADLSSLSLPPFIHERLSASPLMVIPFPLVDVFKFNPYNSSLLIDES